MVSSIYMYYFDFLIKLNFSILIFTFFLCVTVYYSSASFNPLINVFMFLKYFLNFFLLLSFFLFLCTFCLYLIFLNKTNLITILNKNFLVPNYSFFFNSKWEVFNYIYFSFDLFGFLLLFLAYIIGFISLLILDTRLHFNNLKYYFTFYIFLIVVYFFVSVSNYLLFFFFYECLLLPSFLFVFYISPSRRAVQASIYFVIWTQLGSLLVLLVISYFLSITSSTNFYALKLYNFSEIETYILYALLFLGFGFKIPIWPFHYWLTKTHVEAPSGFSVYLSGFLVKSALFGFYKFSNVFSISIDTLVFSLICGLSVLDSSLKMWGQTDLKKLVAYGTIQEMNLIFLVFLWGDCKILVGGIIFSVVHAFLSALMFFLVDCVYRRYESRSIVEVNGILQHTPNLGLSVILMVIFFSGLPGTLKFIVEFFIFSGLIEISLTFCALILCGANFLGLIGFCKTWFNALFGINLKVQKKQVLDLTKKELIILVFIFSCLFFFSFFPYFIF